MYVKKHFPPNYIVTHTAKRPRRGLYPLGITQQLDKKYLCIYLFKYMKNMTDGYNKALHSAIYKKT